MSYFKWNRGFAINEGGAPVNITVLWGGFSAPFIYIFAFGRRWYCRPWLTE